MLQANVPTPNGNERPPTPCPVRDDISHCHCSALEHSCGFCEGKW